jgi:hypothetical protein
MTRHFIAATLLLLSAPAGATTGSWKLDVLADEVVVPRGEAATAIVSVTQNPYCTMEQIGADDNGCPNSVLLRLSGLPAGVSGCFPVTGGCVSQVSVAPGEGFPALVNVVLSASTTASLGASTIRVEGYGSDNTIRTASTTLSVVSDTAYALTFSRTALGQFKLGGTTQITIGRPAGDTSVVSMSIVSPPRNSAGQACFTTSFSPASTTGTSSTLTVTPTFVCGTGVFTLKVRASGGSGIGTASITYSIVYDG